MTTSRLNGRAGRARHLAGSASIIAPTANVHVVEAGGAAANAAADNQGDPLFDPLAAADTTSG